MIKRIIAMAAAVLMLIAAGRVNDESNTERFINRRTGEVRSAAQTPGRGADAAARDLRESGFDSDRTESVSGGLGRRIEPVEVTYDISGITAEIPEGSDPEGDDLDETEVYEGTEPEEGGTDPAITPDSGEDVDGYTGEDLGTDNGDEQAAGGTEQPDPGEEQPSSDLEPAGDDESAADDSGDAEVEEPVPEPEPQMEYLGDWTISFYCNCEICTGQWAGGPTASGVMPSAWWTSATADLPFGTVLYVDGLGEFEVQDRGTGYGWLDIYVSSHDEALANGLQTRSVYIVH